MEDNNLWSTFEETGCVWDYLNYKGIRAIMESDKKGENTVESVDYGDRDDTVRNTNR